MSPIFHSNAGLKQEEFHYLTELQYWSLITAYGLAAADSISLTREHVEVVYWLRKTYDQFGACSIDFFVNKLEVDFELLDSRRYLKTLFPHNSISTWFHIAGLPIPLKNPFLDC